MIQALFVAPHGTFSVVSLLLYSAVYYLLAALTYGAFIPSGLFTVGTRRKPPAPARGPGPGLGRPAGVCAARRRGLRLLHHTGWAPGKELSEPPLQTLLA